MKTLSTSYNKYLENKNHKEILIFLHFWQQSKRYFICKHMILTNGCDSYIVLNSM
jgi:hypothetical protein